MAADPDQAAAATQLSVVLAERYLAATVAFLRRRVDEPVEWQRAAMFGDAILYVTADELAQISEQVEAVLAGTASALSILTSGHRGRATSPSCSSPSPRPARSPTGGRS